MLYYISFTEFPERKASAVQQVRMCEAFASAGVDVCLLFPSKNKTQTTNWEDLADFYGLDTQFRVRPIPVLGGQIDVLPQIGLLSMAGAMTVSLLNSIRRGELTCSDIVYGRNYYALFLFNEIQKFLPDHLSPVVAYEQHDPKSAHWKSQFYKRIDHTITTSKKLKQYDIENFGVPPGKVIVVPHGVDMALYEDLDQSTVRDQLNLPKEETLLMCTGHLHPRKGVDRLIEAAPDIDALVYIVGGRQENIQRLKSQAGHPDNVRFTGYVKHSDMPLYQMAADILVAPYTHSALEINSPLTIFEYLAAGKPIVVTEQEIIQEVLTDGENALFCDTDDVRSLTQTIQRLIEDESLAQDIGTNAAETAVSYSYENRARTILNKLNT